MFRRRMAVRNNLDADLTEVPIWSNLLPFLPLNHLRQCICQVLNKAVRNVVLRCRRIGRRGFAQLAHCVALWI